MTMKMGFESHDVMIRFTMDALGITREEAEQVWVSTPAEKACVEVVDTGDRHD